jgi:hypothetical protein
MPLHVFAGGKVPSNGALFHSVSPSYEWRPILDASAHTFRRLFILPQYAFDH